VLPNKGRMDCKKCCDFKTYSKCLENTLDFGDRNLIIKTKTFCPTNGSLQPT
jgi:hypothetical protein